MKYQKKMDECVWLNNDDNNDNDKNAAHQRKKVEINEEREKIIQNKSCVQNKRKHKEIRTKPKKNHPTIFFI